MDEKKLAELLKEAVADTPPPTFTQSDITRESERQRVRRRNGLLTGSAFGVAVLAGATALGVALWTGPRSASDVTSAESVASSGNGNAAPYELPDEDSAADAPAERGGENSFPSEGPKQGGPSTGNGGPAGPASTPSGCEQVDRELAAALAGELPAAANIEATDASPVVLSCPAGGRGATFDLPNGQLSVLLSPPGSMEGLALAPPGGAEATARTSTGAQVFVVSTSSPESGSVPYESDLSRFATAIAERN
ncbi:hypothetical protein [Actinophytocola sp.]|uniref:hypothetical protein n=1 Tax=Actinophytocola sp. TaxID=1872138 RepID=UPI002ED18BE8